MKHAPEELLFTCCVRSTIWVTSLTVDVNWSHTPHDKAFASCQSTPLQFSWCRRQRFLIKLINIPCSNSILIIFRKIKETIMIIRNLSTERWLLLPCTVVVDSITIDLNRPHAAGWIAAQQPFQPSAATVDHLHFLDHGLKIINYYYLAGRLLGHPCLCPSSADATPMAPQWTAGWYLCSASGSLEEATTTMVADLGRRAGMFCFCFAFCSCSSLARVRATIERVVLSTYLR